MTSKSDPPDERLIEITHFSRYEYGDEVPVPLGLPVLPTYMAIPGDYRTKEEIIQAMTQTSNEEDA